MDSAPICFQPLTPEEEDLAQQIHQILSRASDMHLFCMMSSCVFMIALVGLSIAGHWRIPFPSAPSLILICIFSAYGLAYCFLWFTVFRRLRRRKLAGLKQVAQHPLAASMTRKLKEMRVAQLKLGTTPLQYLFDDAGSPLFTKPVRQFFPLT